MSFREESLPPIPLTVVAGFLGAGKTTLLNRILTAEHGRRIGVVVNDFGSVNIDAELISEVTEGVLTMTNGCICCSIRTDLIRTVMELTARPDRPEHIVIESSGVADPTGIVTSFLDPSIWQLARLDAVITVVDADQVLTLAGAEADLARSQVSGADLVVLNKVDLVDAATLAEAEDWIAGVRPGAPVFQSTHCELPLDIVLGTEVDPGTVSPPSRPEEGDDATTSVDHVSAHDHGRAAPGPIFDTWTFTSDVPLSLEVFQQLLTHLPSTVFRAKGFLQVIEEPDRRMLVQLVGRRATVSPMRDWGDDRPQTRLVFISRSGTVNHPVLEQALRSCEVDEPTGTQGGRDDAPEDLPG